MLADWHGFFTQSTGGKGCTALSKNSGNEKEGVTAKKT